MELQEQVGLARPEAQIQEEWGHLALAAAELMYPALALRDSKGWVVPVGFDCRQT